MLKTGFRGERKGILTPSLSQGEGECSDSKRGMWRRKREEMRNDKGRMTKGMWKKLAVY